jgi:hypothetical protein
MNSSSSASVTQSSGGGGGFGRTTYTPLDLRSQVPAINRFLQVRPCPTNSYNVVVLYTNESDRTGGVRLGSGTGLRAVGKTDAVPMEREGSNCPQQDAYCTILPGGYEHNFGFLILDVCSAVVCQV